MINKLKYPSDEFANKRLTRRLMDCLGMYKEQKEDALNFLDAFPRIPVDRWNFSFPVRTDIDNHNSEEIMTGKLKKFALAIPVTREKCIDLIGVTHVASLPSFNDGIDKIETLDDVEEKYTGGLVDTIIESQKTEYYNLFFNDCPFINKKLKNGWEISKSGYNNNVELNSNPIEDINDWRNEVSADRAIMSEDVFKFLCYKFNINSYIHKKNRELLAEFINLNSVYTISNIKKTINSSFFFIYHSGEYVNPSILKFTLKDFHCADNKHNTDARIIKYIEPNRHSNIIALDMIFSLQIVKSNAGILYLPDYKN